MASPISRNHPVIFLSFHVILSFHVFAHRYVGSVLLGTTILSQTHLFVLALSLQICTEQNEPRRPPAFIGRTVIYCYVGHQNEQYYVTSV